MDLHGAGSLLLFGVTLPLCYPPSVIYSELRDGGEHTAVEKSVGKDRTLETVPSHH
jgi:hypothetical protein